MFVRRLVMTLTAVFVLLESAVLASADSVSAYWDNVALDYIHGTTSEPSVAARTLAVMHAAMYDAWTAYDPIAVPSRANGILKRPPEEITDANKIEAISFAARKALVNLLPSMSASIDGALARLGYDLADAQSADTSTPPGVGNVAAEAVFGMGQYVGNSSHYLAVHKSDPSDDPDAAWQLVPTFEGSRVVQRDSADSPNQ
jgi:hypothetical protein